MSKIPARCQTAAIFPLSMPPKPILPHFCIPRHYGRKDNTQCVSIMKNKPISWHYQIPHRLTAYHPECRTTKPLAFISIATRKATHPFRFSSSLLSAPRIFPHKFETASETFPPFDSS